MSRLIINRLDYARIKRCISDASQSRTIRKEEAEKLLDELAAAKIVEPQDIPSDVVTMNSIVKLSFMNNDRRVQLQIVTLTRPT